MKEHLTSLDYINKTGRELISKAASEEKSGQLEADVKDLNTRWSNVSTAIEDRLSRLERAIGQLKQYEVIQQVPPMYTNVLCATNINSRCPLYSVCFQYSYCSQQVALCILLMFSIQPVLTAGALYVYC